MMTTSKGGTCLATTSQPSQEQLQECCMCGDFGLSSELFRCKICQFRSQHRYCSNIYPKAESYRACNWCLNNEKEDSAEKAQNSFNSSSSNKTTRSDDDDVIKNKKKIINGGNVKNLQGTNGIKNEKGSLKLKLNNHSIKKQRSSPERLPLLAARKRITTVGGAIQQESLRRTKSEDISNNVVRKQVFRNKVRRYKLLEEVSS
ncbi:hypothetical protein ACH5RR_034684 [Cinchona calisaya]|uniref:PHD-type zinc finger plants domain-containing protein n=1 Tax=Cinchona calisaya TaxID=153742 RepID=A0ABD2YH18_9GENT